MENETVVNDEQKERRQVVASNTTSEMIPKVESSISATEFFTVMNVCLFTLEEKCAEKGN
jgi:hypothetical protein